MRWLFRQLALNALKMLAGAAGIFLLFSLGCEKLKDNYNAAADDPAYATAVFEPIVPFAHVLASREYHLIGEDWPKSDCTYAIVELSPNVPETPPSRIEDSDGFRVNGRYRFGGDWLPTPNLRCQTIPEMSCGFAPNTLMTI